MSQYSAEGIASRYDLLAKNLAEKGIDLDEVKEKVSRFSVEVPSWVFGVFGGGRFSGYVPPGAARDVFEKFEDASLVHKLTGATPKVSIHVGWDDPDNAPFDKIEPNSFRRLRDHAQKLGMGIGTVSPTYFLEGTHFGSLSANSPETRSRLIDHSLTAAEIASKYGTEILTLWFPDGSLYPGQVNIRVAERNLKESLEEIYGRMPEPV